MGVNTKSFDNASDMITFSRASGAYGFTKVGYGSELVTNGDFSSSDGWTLKSNTTISGNQLTIDTTSDSSWYSNAIRSDINIVAGKMYYYEVDIESQTPSDILWIYIGGGSVLADAIPLQGTGVITGVHIPTLSTSTLKVEDRHSTPSAHVINSISIKEVLYNSSDPSATLKLIYHPNDVPRIEYNLDGSAKGLLVEESRTNLALSSENFTSWNDQSTGIAIDADAITAPNGTLTADKFKETVDGQGSLNNLHRRGQSVAVSSPAQIRVMSFYAKAAERNLVRFWSWGGVGADTSAKVFNLHDGTMYGSDTVSIDAVGNGWYRCSCLIPAGNTQFVLGPAISTSTSTTTYLGVEGSGIYVWGAQLEESSFPTSYIETTGSTATRAADVASIPVADFGFNDNAGTVFVEASVLNDQNANDRRILEISDGTISNFFSFYQDVSAGENIYIANQSGGSLTANFDTGFTITESSIFKAIATLKDNDVAASVNGGSITTDTSTTISSALSEVNIGYLGGGTQQLNGHIKSITYYPRRLTDAQIQELTT